MRVLYFSPDGILDDLGQSQVLPYVYGLNERGFNFIIFSFERFDRKKEELLSQSRILKSKGIIWYHLPFYPKKFNRFLRFIFGAIKLNLIFRKHKINLIHIRSINAGAIFLLSGIKCRILYDIRAFAGQLGDYGLLNNSFLLKSFIFFEKILIKRSNGIVVLDKSGLDYLRSNYKLNIPIQIIPTSTNIKRFNIKEKFENKNKEIKFVLLGGAQFPYLPRKALEFIKILLKNKVDCTLDIINRRHHNFIKKVIKEANFPKDKIKVFGIKPKEIFEVLPTYDCGLIFIESGSWIRMSSPTKIGEYLAAGLHIVGLEGIDVLERLEKNTHCVDTLTKNFEQQNLSKEKIYKIKEKINALDRRGKSIKLAKEFYDINSALNKYFSIYQNLLK